MLQNVRTILDELYLLEPNLRVREDELVHIIEVMLENQPLPRMDPHFRRELKSQLLKEISYTSRNDNSRSFSLPSWVLSAFGTAFASVVIGTFVFINLFPHTGSGELPRISGKNLLSFAPHVEEMGTNAYKLSPENAGISIDSLSQETSVSKATPMSAKMTISPDMMVTQVTSPDVISYEYLFTGTYTLPDTVKVYRKKSSPFSSQDTSSIIKNLELDGIDLRQFDNASLTSLSFTEKREYGYTVSLDMGAGTLMFSQNTEWPQTCNETGCEPPSKENLISEKDIYTIGETFLDAYGINRTSYGTADIDTEWKHIYSKVQDGSSGTDVLPMQVNILYPLIIDGKEIYESSGGKKGLMLMIDLGLGKVTSMYGLEKQNLEGSLYDTIKDKTRLDDIISNGGNIPLGSIDPKTPRTPITLGNPTLGYVHTYGTWVQGRSNEYYIPAFIFPVIKKPENIYISDTVIVPIVEEFLPDL